MTVKIGEVYYEIAFKIAQDNLKKQQDSIISAIEKSQLGLQKKDEKSKLAYQNWWGKTLLIEEFKNKRFLQREEEKAEKEKTTKLLKEEKERLKKRNELRRKFDKFSKDLIKTALVGLGTTAGAVVGSTYKAISEASNLKTLKNTTGINITKFQQMRSIAEQNNINSNAFQTGVEGLSAKQAEARFGGEVANVFKFLTLDFEKSPLELLKQLPEAFDRLGITGADKTKMLTDL